ncbi:MAG: response regulator [Rhodanobacter sp.]
MRKRIVLLVEDDPETLVVMAAVLRKAGCDVFTATHEDTAIVQIVAHPEINIIITDACFGDGGKGMCMAEQVRRCGSNAAVVVTSTDPYASCATLGKEAIFLLKPYGREALLNSVAAAAAAHEVATASPISLLPDAAGQDA